MNSPLDQAKDNFILGLSRISEFWGFPKAMGAIYAALYLSPAPLTLDDLVQQVGVTKGAISTNARALERLGMVHRQMVLGERKDFYIAETDFWDIVKTILREREKSEFDRALQAVDQSLEMVEQAEIEPEQAERARFYQKRLGAIAAFFRTLDNLVATLIALDELRLGALEKMLGSFSRKSQ